MGAGSRIAWCDDTFNPWIGCTKVSPGCDHCYAEAIDRRMRYGGVTHWGSQVARMRTKPANWEQPLKWDKAQAAYAETMRRFGRPVTPRRVFCASMADVFDNEVPAWWRSDLFNLVASTPNLTWLILTKRASNLAKMLPWVMAGRMPWSNVWLGVSVVDQHEADRDIPKLLDVPAAIRFVSYEPAMGPVDFSPYLVEDYTGNLLTGPCQVWPALDWVIIGGESGGHARTFMHRWGKNVIAQCQAAGVAVFMKQMGSNARNAEGEQHKYRHRAGADPMEWQDSMRVQQFPQEGTK